MKLPTWWPAEKPWIIGDCIQGMKKLPRDCVDLVYTDPVWPDCIPEIAGKDNAVELFRDSVKQMARISKRICIHLGCDTDPRMLRYVPKSHPFLRVFWLRYIKPHYKGRLLWTSDVAYFFGEYPPSRPRNRVVGGECNNDPNNKRRTNHPCYRDLTHSKFIITKCSNPGEIILDPFVGSGTTLKAARLTGRIGLGYEIEPDYESMIKESSMCEIKPLEGYFESEP